MREKLKDKNRLLHIIEAIDNIFEFVEGKDFNSFNNDKILYFAIIKNLEIIGEASYLLTSEFREENPQVQWDAIIAMRHILVHGYYQIKNEIIWDTINIELKPLKEEVVKLLDK